MPAVESTEHEGGADLAARLHTAEAEIASLRMELFASRAEARAISESIPHAVSRRMALRSLLADIFSPSAWVAGLRARR